MHSTAGTLGPYQVSQAQTIGPSIAARANAANKRALANFPGATREGINAVLREKAAQEVHERAAQERAKHYYNHLAAYNMTNGSVGENLSTRLSNSNDIMPPVTA